MSLVKGKGKQTSGIDIVSEGSEQYLRLLRDGSILNMPWVMSKVAQGKVFGVNAGILTTPVTTNAGVAVDGEPDLLVGVPSGTTIIPVYLFVGFEDTGVATAPPDVFAVSSPINDTTNTSTALTIRNLRLDNPFASNCTAQSVVTAGGTACESGNYFEFWRPYGGFGEDAFNGATGWVNNAIHGARWTIGDCVVPPYIVGSGSLNLFASATTGTAFITAIWIEEPTVNLT